VLEITRPRLLRWRALAWNDDAASSAARAFLDIAISQLEER
jgi:hypothetical protein